MPSRSLAELAELGLIDAGWAKVLAPVQPQLTAMGNFLRTEHAEGREYLPTGDNVLRAFRYPFDAVRVLIVGQDPYPTPGHPIGLSFAVERHVRPIPRSLTNIYKELGSDLDITPPAHGDLTAWSEHGVMLLNRVLTVRPGAAGSHRRKGWESITEQAITALAAREKPLVAILWGRDAQTAAAALGNTPIVASAHPSPLSASSGFFGSKPFSRANDLLVAQGSAPVDWSLD